MDDPTTPGDSDKPPCLRNVLISDSRILGWQRSGNTVSFLIKASIGPRHPAYVDEFSHHVPLRPCLHPRRRHTIRH